MKTITVLLSAVLSFHILYSQNYAALFIPGYQFGKVPVTGPSGDFNYHPNYITFSGGGIKDGLFVEADGTILFHGFLDMINVNSNAQGHDPENLEGGFFSFRLGGVTGTENKIGFAWDMDVHVTNFRYDNTNLYFGTGPMLVALFPIGETGVSIMPKVGYDMNFTDRQTKPIDGHTLIFETGIGIRLYGAWGIALQPMWHSRTFIQDDYSGGSFHTKSNMFLTRIGIGNFSS